MISMFLHSVIFEKVVLEWKLLFVDQSNVNRINRSEA